MQTNTRRIARQSGFTLVELMVVVVILGLLAGLGGVVMMKRLEDAKLGVAKAKAEELDQAIETYIIQRQTSPSPEEILDEMVEAGEFRSPDKINDPWDEKMMVELGDDGYYRTFSKGKDKQSGTEDDIFAQGLRSEIDSY